ncbi:DUF6011 domain-containing protein [Streptomyces sp. M10(2022)]
MPEPFPESAAQLRPEDATGQAPGRRTVRCRVCGRPLTGTASRRTGLGPACDARLHPAGPDTRARRRDADQDTLPGI